MLSITQKPSRVVDSHRTDNMALSSAWDTTNKGKHGGSSTALDDPLLQGMSPEEFASHEEWDHNDWDTSGKKKKIHSPQVISVLELNGYMYFSTFRYRNIVNNEQMKLRI